MSIFCNFVTIYSCHVFLLCSMLDIDNLCYYLTTMFKNNQKIDRQILLTYICIAVLVVIEVIELFFLIYNPRPANVIQCISVLAVIVIGIWTIKIQRKSIIIDKRITDLKDQIIATNRKTVLVQEETQEMEHRAEMLKEDLTSK